MNKITSDHLRRAAYIYVRQSTPDQVRNNLESKRRQYGLADRARSLGWTDVVVIDDDLGRTGDGEHRPGFERLLAALCEGQVGAVFSIEGSRLARSGRDWHTLLEFCRLVETLLIDENGVYDPREPNDRLLLGMKGTLAEMELATMRQRSQEALMQKARRGELFTSLPIGFVRAANDRIEVDPDRRIREAIMLIFRRFQECGSVRQVLLWIRQEGIELPSVVYGAEGRAVQWRLPVYNAVLKILTNPTHGGAYVYGRTKTIVRIEQGRKRSLGGQRVAPEDWQIVIPSHHEGYISWDEYQRNQRQIAHNAAMKGAMVRGPARNGGALLAGLFRCGHCGRKLHVAYSGTEGQCLRYACRGAQTNHGVDHCISFGGLTADRLVVEEVLRRLEPLGIQAALQAIDREFQSGNEKIAQKQLSLEQLRFEVTRARRQYDAVDPDNRLVCSELERRWNEALKRYNDIEAELNTLRAGAPESLSQTTRQRILELGRDLPAVWHHPQSPQQLKKRIVRTLLHEIVVRIEGERVLMLLHWQGGDHTSLDFIKNQPGRHRYTTPKNVVQLVRELARVQPDRAIVALLNMMRMRTGHGHAWTEARLRVFRHDHDIAAYVEGERLARGELTLEEAAAMLKISTETVRRLILQKVISGRQACKGAPWIIQRKDVERLATETGPHTKNIDQLSLKLQ